VVSRGGRGRKGDVGGKGMELKGWGVEGGMGGGEVEGAK